ncbi:MAG: metal transporter [Haloarculaceae archaeon]
MRNEQTDDGVTTGTEGLNDLGLSGWASALAPVVLLIALLALVAVAPPFAGVQAGEPLPDVTVTHATLPNDETIVVHVTNNGPDPVTIEQVLVDEAYWSHTVHGGEPDPATLAPLESARVEIPYHWTPGWDLDTELILEDGTTIHHGIVAPQPSPGMTPGVLWTLALVGVFVGVIPVALGMLWYPFMQRLDTQWLHAVLALSAGVLAFLAFDAGFEAFEIAERVPGAFEGQLLVVAGALGTVLLVQALSSWLTAGNDVTPLGLAYLVALGIGLHNLAEGLAIGSSFALGRVSLGTFLIVGFMIHNVTEGPAVVAPVAGTGRPPLAHFAGLGLLAGAPVILGGWVGGFAFSPTLGAFFLAVGVGAIVQVDWELASMIRKQGRLATASNLLAFLVGFVLMYATDLLVAL